jgi:DNA-binding CsgD family transcriptional regulator
MLLLDDFAAVSRSGSVDALRNSAERFAGELEFERYALQFLTPKLDGALHWASLDNVPEGYRALWKKPGAGAVCPVMQHAKAHSLPLFWSRETYERVNNVPKWEQQAPWGYGTGFIVAAHLGEDKHVVVSLEREKPLVDTPERLTHKLASFQLFATCAIDACVVVLSGGVDDPDRECPLTKRELETLQWTYIGKTAWEVGQILGITERTAALHATTAAHKLSAVSKHQAALKAQRLGWIC